MAKTAGKMMSEFRKVTTDFKETWEKEVEFEEFKSTNEIKTVSPDPNSVSQSTALPPSEMETPEVKEIRQEDFEKHFPTQAASAPASEIEPQATKVPTGKQDWL